MFQKGFVIAASVFKEASKTFSLIFVKSYQKVKNPSPLIHRSHGLILKTFKQKYSSRDTISSMVTSPFFLSGFISEFGPPLNEPKIPSFYHQATKRYRQIFKNFIYTTTRY
jgi:hypothetical protein